MHQQQHTSIESFNRLVKLAARAFYDDITTKGENQLKSGRSDNRGIAVVVLDALTRRQWVREEDLARDLKLHSKQLRRILRLFEEEKLVTRDHRKETAKNAKIFSAAVAAVDTHHFGREGEEKAKLHTHSYCCLDYAQIHDVVRYRLQRMKKKIKDELDDKNKIQEYVCPTCQRRYTALDALRLISMVDENFHCEKCNGELVAVSDDKLATQEVGDGDDNARRRRRDKLNDMLRKLEDQLKPLTDQLGRVKDLTPPEFGSLQAWEVRANAAARADPTNDPSKNGQDIGFSSTPMPFVGETKVEVAFSGIEDKGENIKSESGSTPMKVLPPWMIKQGMNLTKEQRGEVKQEQSMDNSSVHASSSDDKKGTSFEKDEKNSIQDEYIKAYYAAILKQQESVKGDPQTSVTNNTNVERQVGVKAKREDEDEGEDVEWEEDTPAGDTTESFKVDLNVEADASGDDEDEIDWEEG